MNFARVEDSFRKRGEKEFVENSRGKRKGDQGSGERGRYIDI